MENPVVYHIYINRVQTLIHHSASDEGPFWTETGQAMKHHQALLVMCIGIYTIFFMLLHTNMTSA